MSEAIFWMILSLFDWSKEGDDGSVIEPAIVELAKRPGSEIIEFEEILARKLFTLDTLAHAKAIGEKAYVAKDGFFSADWFLYSRCVVIANGKELYEEVLTKPSSFPKDLEFESLLRVGREAYQRKTGNEYDEPTKVSYETFSNKDGWK